MQIGCGGGREGAQAIDYPNPDLSSAITATTSYPQKRWPQPAASNSNLRWMWIACVWESAGSVVLGAVSADGFP